VPVDVILVSAGHTCWPARALSHAALTCTARLRADAERPPPFPSPPLARPQGFFLLGIEEIGVQVGLEPA
jgi:hypothetical protein